MSSRIVWITGASSGIGRSLARRLAQDGHQIAASARSEQPLQALAEEARETAGDIHPFPLDVADQAATRAVTEEISKTLGPIDLAVLNAGTHHPVNAESFKAEEFARLVDVNLLGVAHCLEPLLAAMIERRKGQIAIVASVAGYRGLPTSAYYGATKAALINLAESLKFDLDRLGVKLQLVDPGFVKTPLTDKNPFDMPFLIDPDTAADRMVTGFESSGFEIIFPRRFVFLMKALRCLPYRFYFPLVRWMTGK